MMPRVSPAPDPLDTLPPPATPAEAARVAEAAARAFRHHADVAQAPLGRARRAWSARLELGLAALGALALLAWAVAWLASK
jgi:hypothetical protein